MTPTRDELLPCPFCLDGQPFIHECDWCEPHEFNVTCSCGAMTRASDSRDKAIANWNRRTRPEAQMVWVQYAFAALGFMRDKMHPDDVTTVQKFLAAAQEGVTKP